MSDAEVERAIDACRERDVEYRRQVALIRPDDPITPERLIAAGFQTDDEKGAGEYEARIVGGDDDGEKHDSDDDRPGDEIACLVISPPDKNDLGTWTAFVESYEEHSSKTVAAINLGSRTTMGDVFALCRALKAWAVRYPEESPC